MPSHPRSTCRKPFKVVIDCGNGVAGLCCSRVIRGVRLYRDSAYCEVDGNFPNYHLDPTRYENLWNILLRVLNSGNSLRILALRSMVMPTGSASRYEHWSCDRCRLHVAGLRDGHPAGQPEAPHDCLDVKSSHHLTNVITAAQGIPVMCKSGHSYVK